MVGLYNISRGIFRPPSSFCSLAAHLKKYKMTSDSSHVDNSHTIPSPGFTSSVPGSTNEPLDPLARSIDALLAPTVQTTTEKLYQAQQSQLAVGAELERLVFRKHSEILPFKRLGL